MPELEMSEGAGLYYEEIGDPEAPPVVLLHGCLDDSRMWAPVAQRLASDYRVIAPDLPGYGRSAMREEEEPTSVERLAVDVLALIGSAGGLAAVAATGLGAMAALQAAVTSPALVAALVVSDVPPWPGRPVRGDEAREHERRLEADEDVVRKFGTSVLGKRRAAELRDPFLGEALRARYARISRETYLAAARARRERPDILGVLASRLTMPVMIVTGERDPWRPEAEAMHAELPGARFAVFRDMGQGVPALQPDAYARAVMDFFHDIEDGNPVAATLTR